MCQIRIYFFFLHPSSAQAPPSGGHFVSCLLISSAEDRVYNERGRKWGRCEIAVKGEGEFPEVTDSAVALLRLLDDV